MCAVSTEEGIRRAAKAFNHWAVHLSSLTVYVLDVHAGSLPHVSSFHSLAGSQESNFSFYPLNPFLN